MRRLIFQPEHDQFRERVREFILAEVAPHKERWRKAGLVDREVYLKAGAEGLLCIYGDKRYGGSDIQDFRYNQILIEENNRFGDIGFYMQLHSDLVGPYIAYLTTDEQKTRWMPGIISGELILAIAMTEPCAGSDLAGIQSFAENKGDHWLLNGEKAYISNGLLSDLIVVAARTDRDSRHGLGLFVVERGMEGFERGPNLTKMGMKSQDTASLYFNNVRIPHENVLGDPAQGFRYMGRFLSQERLVGSIGFMAAAQKAFDMTLDYVRERHAFGKPIGAFQGNRFKMAEMRAEIDAIQTFVDQCVLLRNTDELTGGDAAEAKFLSSELQGRVMDACVQLHGGLGYMDDHPISRMFTDARVTRIFAGSSEIMKEIIGRGLGLDERKLAKRPEQQGR